MLGYFSFNSEGVKIPKQKIQEIENWFKTTNIFKNATFEYNPEFDIFDMVMDDYYFDMDEGEFEELANKLANAIEQGVIYISVYDVGNPAVGYEITPGNVESVNSIDIPDELGTEMIETIEELKKVWEEKDEEKFHEIINNLIKIAKKCS